MNLLARFALFVRRRSVMTVLTLLLTLVLGVMVVATIYFTLFDLQWLAFLGGILFAAILSMASQASRAEWLIVRKSRQLDRAREQLVSEKSRAQISENALRVVEERARMVNDLLPMPILYIDRDLRIRHHNRVFLKMTDWPAERIDGQLLRDVCPREYPSLLPRFQETLAGNMISYNMAWSAADGTSATYLVKQVPYPPASDRALGFYILMLPEHGVAQASEPPAAARSVANESTPHAAITNDSGETLYLHSLSDQLTGSDNPRNKLVRALQNNEFLLFKQKILPLKTKPFDHGCYEILLRLQEEEDHLLPPGGFIPLAERYGMTEDIDRWVVRNLIAWSLQQQQTHPGWEIPMFCVNLSEAAVSNPEFARFVRQELQRSAFPASQLCFEIGELETIHSHASVKNFITALKPAGCRFTVDAFGSVKLSFTHLSGLAVDFIKIDGVIIQNLFKTPADSAKVRAIVTVCQKLGVQTIGEFVEDDRTLEKLRELGVDYAQGFGIDRPGPISNLSRSG